jgi:hypothetical protein
MSVRFPIGAPGTRAISTSRFATIPLSTSSRRRKRLTASDKLSSSSGLAPYQSPTYRAISISTKDDDRKDRGTTVLHTIEQVKEQLLLRGVSPDQFARALMQKPKLLEHDGESNDDK